MHQHRILSEPSLSLAVPVYVCAAFVFPFQLGWSGAPLVNLLLYLALAAMLFTLADVIWHRSLYPALSAATPQAILFALMLAPPAALSFAVGTAFEPIDEAFAERVCAARNSAESDTAMDEFDDAFDLTADCVKNATG